MPIYLEGNKHSCDIPYSWNHEIGTIWQCPVCLKFHYLHMSFGFRVWDRISRRKAERLKYKAWKKRYR